MQATAPVLQARQVVLCGLEVLRLIGDRMESRHNVDGEDIQVVLGFMNEVAHRCLEAGRLEKAQKLFLELRRTARLNSAEEFVIVSRSYTSLLADIFLANSPEHTGFEIREAARLHAQLFRRLETKYTGPHCI